MLKFSKSVLWISITDVDLYSTKHINMETALERLLDYVGRSHNDVELDNLIEDINGICGTIERINIYINDIEQERDSFGSVSTDLELRLQALKKRLTQEINKL